MLRVGSLFSGAGLCDLGLARAGFNHQFFCEVDPFCRAILARHWPGIPIYEDIRLMHGHELPPVDVLCGGFPCQDVSSAGKRSGIKEGTRSGLWREYARIVEEIRPRYVIIENVRGLLARGIEIVLRELAGIGYDAEWEVLPAAAFGAPHHRERVFVSFALRSISSASFTPKSAYTFPELSSKSLSSLTCLPCACCRFLPPFSDGP